MFDAISGLWYSVHEASLHAMARHATRQKKSSDKEIEEDFWLDTGYNKESRWWELGTSMSPDH